MSNNTVEVTEDGKLKRNKPDEAEFEEHLVFEDEDE